MTKKEWNANNQAIVTASKNVTLESFRARMEQETPQEVKDAQAHWTVTGPDATPEQLGAQPETAYGVWAKHTPELLSILPRLYAQTPATEDQARTTTYYTDPLHILHYIEHDRLYVLDNNLYALTHLVVPAGHGYHTSYKWPFPEDGTSATEPAQTVYVHLRHIHNRQTRFLIGSRFLPNVVTRLVNGTLQEYKYKGVKQTYIRRPLKSI